MQPTVFHNMDLVNADDRGQAVSTVDDCFATHDLGQLPHDGLLGVGIQVARRLVEEENLRLWLHEPPRNEDALALAATQLGANVADLGLVPVRHRHDALVHAALLGDSLDVVLGGLGISVAKIRLDRVIEQDSVLGHHHNVLSEGLKSQIFHVLIVNRDSALDRVVDPKHQMQH